MSHLVTSVVIFAIGYLINVFFITVLYHRGLAHRSVRLNSTSFGLTRVAGPWLTGIDPKAWVCMHRLHHMHSDTAQDPHSPHYWGIWGVAWGQLKSYEGVLSRLARKDPELSALVADIPFNISILNRKGIWFLPYLLHAGVAVAIALGLGSAPSGIAYFLGIMSHPIQGWMVNSLSHRFGYRNFATPDQSRNNSWIAGLVFGEGYQNNHHAFPGRADFAHASGEFDLGYVLCRVAGRLGLVEVPSPS